MTVDARDRIAEDVFTWRATKQGKVLISWRWRIVTTLHGGRAQALLRNVEQLDRRREPLLLPRVTGNFKHGNER